MNKTNENADALVKATNYLAVRLVATAVILSVVIGAGGLAPWVGPIATMVATPALYLTWFGR